MSTEVQRCSANRAYREGAVSILPVLVGIVPFAMVAGLAGVQNGFSILETAGFSALAYAGAAQIAALDLIGQGSPAGVVIATAIVINLRFIVYSAALAPHFADAGVARRALASYVLVDHAVALSLSRFEHMESRRARTSFYLGACLTFWLTWQVSALAGSLLGALPTSGTTAGALTFAVPLSFLGLLAPQLRSSRKVVAALAAGTVSILAAAAPASAGLMLAIVVGIAAGLAHRSRDGSASGGAS